MAVPDRVPAGSGQPQRPESGLDAGSRSIAAAPEDGVVARSGSGRGAGRGSPMLLPMRRPTGRSAPLPIPLRSGLSRAIRWRQQAELEPIGATLLKVARHPAVVGSASAAGVLVARAGVEVLRGVITKDRRRQPAGRVIVGRRVRVEYVEMWSRSR
jgi:hypothetical protein